MSDDRVSRVSVRLLDREYQVACPSEERADLLDSAEYLDAKMREVRDTGKVVGLDRIAVISALNLDIASAHITTFGEKVIDSFYVTDLNGHKITQPARETAIRRKLVALFDKTEHLAAK